MPAAQAMAPIGLRARRNDAAAGPMRRAVLRMAPIVRAQRATERARAAHVTPTKKPTECTRTPCAAASSALTEISNNGLYTRLMSASPTAPRMTTRGRVPVLTAKIEPNITGHHSPGCVSAGDAQVQEQG